MHASTLIRTSILFSMLLVIPLLVGASPTLHITVEMGNPSYQVEQEIYVYGVLTYEDSPVPGRLVAIEVQNPSNGTVVSRTRQTDGNGAYNLTFKLLSDSELGTYTVYVSSNYMGETATSGTAFELSLPHDVAVTKVETAKIVVGQNFTANVSLTLVNQGGYPETFNVTAYANTTTIGSENVTLPAGNSTTITFTWNTTGFAYGNYSISAYASPVEGETLTEDNTLVDGLVYVSIPGDINGDQYVNAKDAVILGGAFYPAGTYSPNADINGDGYCNAKDAVILGTYFGQHW